MSVNNVAWGDFEMLVQKIVVARNAEFRPFTAEAILAYLKFIGWEASKEIVGRLIKLKTIPANVMAELEDMYADYKQRIGEYHEYQSRQKMAAAGKIATPEESKWFWTALLEAMKYPWTVVAFSAAGELTFSTVEKWEAAGQPKHWKAPCVYLCHNPRYQNAYDRSCGNKDDSLANYYKAYYDALVAWGEKRRVKAVAA